MAVITAPKALANKDLERKPDLSLGFYPTKVGCLVCSKAYIILIRIDWLVSYLSIALTIGEQMPKLPKFNTRVLPVFAKNLVITSTNLIADFAGDGPKYVVLELKGGFPIRKQKRKLIDIIPEISKKENSLEELQTVIDSLIDAKWLQGIVFKFADLSLDPAKAYMLRKQIERIIRSNKEVIVYSNSFNIATYYLASAASKIVMPESAEFNLNGFAISKIYKKDFLKRFGVSFEKLAIKEYKSAVDDMALSKMTKTDKEQLNALLTSWIDTITTAIAKNRSTEPEIVVNWIDSYISSANQAKELGLIDEVLYEDELFNEQYKTINNANRFLKNKRLTAAARVAIISLEGAIVTGKTRNSSPLPIFGTKLAGSDTIVADFRKAEADEHTKAIVFYVNSPGGSPLASDLVWRELIRIQKTKPVVVVMGFLAASGGYYVAAAADKIIAAPTTITGSIGVVMGKPVLKEFYKQQSLNIETVKRGKFADSMGLARAFTKEEKDNINKYMNEVYDRFVDRVAKGRGLSSKEVNKIGRGRVWSAKDALAINLVDELGDLELGIQRAKELAGLPNSAGVYNISTKAEFVLAKVDTVEAIIQTINPLLKERALLMSEFSFNQQDFV